MEPSFLQVWLILALLGLFGGGGENAEIDEAEVARGAAQIGVLVLRSQAAVEYDEIVYDKRSGVVSIEGLDIVSPQGAAEIGAVRISSPERRDAVALRYEVENLTMRLSSLDLPTAAKLQVALLGFDEITASSAIEVGYDLASSDARVSITQDVEEIGRVALTLDFVDLRLITTDEALNELPEPKIGGALAAATLSFENDGALEAGLELSGLERPTPQQAADLAGRIAWGLAATLAGREEDPGFDPSRAPPAIRDLAAQAETEIARFLTEGDRLAVTIEPAEPVAFEELEALAENGGPSLAGRAMLISRLRPEISAAPSRPALLIPSTAAAPTDNPEAVLATAAALARGLGAPQNPSRAVELLRPLADAGHPEAARLLAETLAARGGAGDLAEAYGYAILVEAAGDARAAPLASELATRLSAADQLGAEDAALAALPPSPAMDERLEAARGGDAVAMRRLAEAYAGGDGVSRNLKQAYYWSLLAAAAGERSAVGLRDRLAASFDLAEEADAALWAAERQRLADQALADWDGGLGEAAQ